MPDHQSIIINIFGDVPIGICEFERSPDASFILVYASLTINIAQTFSTTCRQSNRKLKNKEVSSPRTIIYPSESAIRTISIVVN